MSAEGRAADSVIETVASFRLDETWFGVDVTRVREVAHDLVIEPFPRAPAGVLGLVSRRGQVLAAIDTRQRLGLPPAEVPGSTYFLVAGGDEVSCLQVDREDAVLEVESSEIEAAPNSLPDSIRPHVRGVCQHDRGLLTLLDIDGVLATPEQKGVSSRAGPRHR